MTRELLSGGAASIAVPVALGLLVGVSTLVSPYAALGLLVLGVVAWVGMRWPVVLVLGIFAAGLFDRVGVTGAKVAALPVTASKLAVVGAIGLWAGHCVSNRRVPVRYHPVFVAMVLFVLVTGVGVVWHNCWEDGKFTFFGLGMVTVLTALVYVILADEDLRWFYRGVGVTLLGGIALGLVGGSQSARASGTFGDPNEWAAFVLLTSAVVLGGLVYDDHPLGRALRLGLLVGAPLAVLSSGSRAALLTGGVVAASVLWMGRRRVGELALVVGGGMVVAPFVVDVSTAVERFTRLLGRFTGQSLVMDGSLDERGELLRQGLDLFANNWVFGAGPGRFAAATGFISHDWRLRVAHNTYLEIASEMGVIGLLAMLVVVGTVASTLVHAWRVAGSDAHRARVQGAATGLVAVAMMAATLGLLVFAVGYLMLGVALAVSFQAQQGQSLAIGRGGADGR